MKTSIC